MLKQFARDLRATYYMSPFSQVRLLHLWLVIAALYWGLTPWTMLTRAFEQWSLVVIFVLLGVFAKPIILILRLVGFVALSWIAFSGFAWAGWFTGYFHHYTTPPTSTTCFIGRSRSTSPITGPRRAFTAGSPI